MNVNFKSKLVGISCNSCVIRCAPMNISCYILIELPSVMSPLTHAHNLDGGFDVRDHVILPLLNVANADN